MPSTTCPTPLSCRDLKTLGKLKEVFGTTARQARLAEIERRLAAHSETLVAHNDKHAAHRNDLRTIGELNGLDEAQLEKLASAIAETFDAIALRRGHPLGKDFRDIWRRAQ